MLALLHLVVQHLPSVQLHFMVEMAIHLVTVHGTPLIDAQILVDLCLETLEMPILGLRLLQQQKDQ